MRLGLARAPIAIEQVLYYDRPDTGGDREGREANRKAGSIADP